MFGFTTLFSVLFVRLTPLVFTDVMIFRLSNTGKNIHPFVFDNLELDFLFGSEF